VSRRDWTLLLALAAIWGVSYLLIKIGVRDFSPAMVVLIRVFFGALVLVPVALGRGALAGARERAGWLVLVALAQVAAPFLLIALGEQQISSALAGILVASAPIWTALLATFVDEEEQAHGLRLAGIVAGIAGVVVLLGLDLAGNGDELLGGLAVVFAGLGYAIGGLLAKKKLKGIEPIGVATLVLVLGTALIAPVAALTAPSETPGIGPLAALIGLGVVGTGLAFAIFYRLIATVGPARTFLVTYLAPGFAVVYGATFLDESIGVAALVGLALILAGSYVAAEGRLPWVRRPEEEAEPKHGPDSPPGLAAARD
jgi:drug/metabolite transporter (DMT)-like permease